MEQQNEKRLYEVKLPFAATGYWELEPPMDYPHNIHVEPSDGDYLAIINLEAQDANSALNEALKLLGDLCSLLAVAGGAFLILNDGRKTVRRLNAPYVADGPPPPFEVVGAGMVYKAGIEFIDPTGELRRAGKIVNIPQLKVKVTHSNTELESKLLLTRHVWDERLRSALALFHLAQCETDLAVAFVLCYTTLEVLAGDDAHALLKVVIPHKKQRKDVLVQISTLLESLSFTPEQIERFMNQIRNTRELSQLDTFQSYLEGKGVIISRSDLDWFRTQRGKFVHAGGFDRSREATSKMQGLQEQIRQALKQELDTVQETIQ